MRKSLTRQERLKKRSDLKRIFASRRQVTGIGAKLKYAKNGLERNRIVVSVSRKYGTSVKRNKAKRVVKEIYRNMKENLVSGYDVAIMLFPGECDFSRRKEQIEQLFRKAGMVLIRDPGRVE